MGVAGEDVLCAQRETFARCVPQDTCSGEVPDNKRLQSLGFRKFALYWIHFMKNHRANQHVEGSEVPEQRKEISLSHLPVSKLFDQPGIFLCTDHLTNISLTWCGVEQCTWRESVQERLRCHVLHPLGKAFASFETGFVTVERPSHLHKWKVCLHSFKIIPV